MFGRKRLLSESCRDNSDHLGIVRACKRCIFPHEWRKVRSSFTSTTYCDRCREKAKCYTFRHRSWNYYKARWASLSDAAKTAIILKHGQKEYYFNYMTYHINIPLWSCNGCGHGGGFKFWDYMKDRFGFPREYDRYEPTGTWDRLRKGIYQSGRWEGGDNP